MSRSGTKIAANPWTAQELSTLHRLREQGQKYFEIAAQLPGRTASQCARRFSYSVSGARYNENRKRERANANARIGRPTGAISQSGSPKIDDQIRARQLRRLEAYDARDVSASIFGDPPKGFSALDLRERASA